MAWLANPNPEPKPKPKRKPKPDRDGEDEDGEDAPPRKRKKPPTGKTYKRGTRPARPARDGSARGRRTSKAVRGTDVFDDSSANTEDRERVNDETYGPRVVVVEADEREAEPEETHEAEGDAEEAGEVRERGRFVGEGERGNREKKRGHPQNSQSFGRSQL